VDADVGFLVIVNLCLHNQTRANGDDGNGNSTSNSNSIDEDHSTTSP